MEGVQYSLLRDVYNIPNVDPVPPGVFRAGLGFRPAYPHHPVRAHTHYIHRRMPAPARLSQLDAAVAQHDASSSASVRTLPHMMWVVGYLGLVVLTAIGIRSGQD
jgi:hypothetical protein